MTVHVKPCDTLNSASLAVSVTLYVPAVVGVPVMVRAPLLTVSPAGRPVALNVIGSPSGSLTAIETLTAVPTVPVRLPGLVSTGARLGAGSMVQEKLCGVLNGPLLAVTVTLNVPAVVGVPEIVPVPELMDRPAGRPEADQM